MKCSDHKELINAINSIFPKHIDNQDVVFVCIGTDRSTGDALAPLVGTNLKRLGYTNVFGTVDEPVHALNLSETLEILPKDKTVIAVDACLGKFSSVGTFRVNKGPMKPGEGVKKDLPTVGDFHILGIVNVCGFMEYFVLQNTRLSVVMNMSNTITNSIVERFPIAMQEVAVTSI